MSAEARLKERNITLPAQPTPMANYVSAVRTGALLFLSGHGPVRGKEGKPSVTGKVGKELTLEQGYQAAREVGFELVGLQVHEAGSLTEARRRSTWATMSSSIAAYSAARRSCCFGSNGQMYIARSSISAAPARSPACSRRSASSICAATSDSLEFAIARSSTVAAFASPCFL